MRAKLIVASIGGVLLVIGTFLPIVAIRAGALFNTSYSLYQLDTTLRIIAYLLLAIGLCSVVVAFLQARHKYLLPLGILSLVMTTIAFILVQTRLANARAAMADLPAFMQFMVTISNGWGWVVLFLGGLSITAAALLGTSFNWGTNWKLAPATG